VVINWAYSVFILLSASSVTPRMRLSAELSPSKTVDQNMWLELSLSETICRETVSPPVTVISSTTSLPTTSKLENSTDSAVGAPFSIRVNVHLLPHPGGFDDLISRFLMTPSVLTSWYRCASVPLQSYPPMSELYSVIPDHGG